MHMMNTRNPCVNYINLYIYTYTLYTIYTLHYICIHFYTIFYKSYLYSYTKISHIQSYHIPNQVISYHILQIKFTLATIMIYIYDYGHTN